MAAGSGVTWEDLADQKEGTAFMADVIAEVKRLSIAPESKDDFNS